MFPFFIPPKLPALLLPGLTVVVSPLLALMKVCINLLTEPAPQYSS